jgi:phosphatidylserine decarboxylase
MLVGTLILAAAAWGLALLAWPAALVVVPVWVWLIAFFRDPQRPVPDGPNLMVSPADGRVTDVREVAHVEALGGPAVRVGIFLSVFNVHVNRSPCAGRVAAVTYKEGRFLSALRHDEASQHNEANSIVLHDAAGQPVAMVVQIAGLIARRIVCTAKPGDALQRGQRIGMIKFGSRTELYIPKRLGPVVQVKIGQPVRGAQDVLATLSAPAAV